MLCSASLINTMSWLSSFSRPFFKIIPLSLLGDVKLQFSHALSVFGHLIRCSINSRSEYGHQLRQILRLFSFQSDVGTHLYYHLHAHGRGIDNVHTMCEHLCFPIFGSPYIGNVVPSHLLDWCTTVVHLSPKIDKQRHLRRLPDYFSDFVYRIECDIVRYSSYGRLFSPWYSMFYGTLR